MSTTKWPRIAAVGLFLAAIAGSLPAGTFNSAERTTTHTLTSKALGEIRTVLVRTPVDYSPERQYPVVYVTDAEWNFELVASYLDYLADNEVYPPLIVTGVINVNRNRDYIPRPDPHFDDTGEADRFLDFVQEEWVPHIQQNYPAAEQRILVGHSFGGVIALHTFFTRPTLFEAYMALGASAWIAGGVLSEEAQAWFDAPKNADAFVYMAVGEGDGGPTVPSSQALATLFKEQAPASLDWTFDITPRTDHFKNTVSGMHNAFMALFPAWGFAEELAAAAANGAEGVDAWFAAKQEALGYRFVPAWFDLGVAAMGMARQDQLEAALATMRHLRGYYPNNAEVAAFSAGIYFQDGKLNEAEQEYLRAIEITQSEGLHPNEMHLGRLQRGLAQVREAKEG